MYVDYAQKAVETGNDIGTSQQLLSLAQEMITNSPIYFQS
jgi:hypothetical protein